MARKSKRAYLLPEESPAVRNMYRVAVYVRLSIEEKRDRKESESIEYQKQLIFDYIKEQDDMEIYAVYCDNGETGTNFERDDFQRMMYDVYNGKVNCIIVKDLSRFGREYIEMGDYLEKIFPLIGVRFIAINDHYDNKVEMFNISVPIKNIINTLYAKDLSKKSAAALRMKQINGEYIGDHPVYGYVKSKEDKHKLVIDEEAAEVVRMIFNWKAEGCSNVSICRKLFELKIMPPARYKYDKGILKNKKYANLEHWTDSTIALMLKNEMYIGNMPQGKTKSHFFDGKRIEKIKPEDWVIVEGTHEPIVSKDLFDKVQHVVMEYRETHKKVFEAQRRRKPVENVLKGKVLCGTCGHKCKLHGGMRNGKPNYHYRCSLHIAFPQECDYISVKDEMLKEIVLKSVKLQISGLADLKMSFDKIMKKQNTKRRMADLTGRISNALTTIANIKSKRIRLSADLAKRYISDAEYGILREQYDDELNVEIKKLNSIYKEQESLNKLLSIEKWVTELKKYGKAKKLTSEIVDAFVENIKLYPDKRIEISWKHTEVFAEAVSLLEGGEQLVG